MANNARLLEYVRARWCADRAVPAAPVLRAAGSRRCRSPSAGGGNAWCRQRRWVERARADAGSQGGTALRADTPVRPVSHDRVTDETRAGRASSRRTIRCSGVPNRISGARLGGLGPGARALLRAEPGTAAYQPVLETHDEGEPPLRGRAAGATGGEGDLRLHRAQLLPPAAGGRAGCVAAVRQSAGAWRMRRSREGR